MNEPRARRRAYAGCVCRGVGMPADQAPSYQPNESSADPLSVAEPLAGLPTVEIGASARALDPHHCLRSRLLLIISFSPASNSLRATGAPYPETRLSQVADGVTRQAP